MTSKQSFIESDECLAKVHVPIKLIHGTNDFFVPYQETVNLFKTLNNDVEVFPIEGSGHGPHEDNESLFIDIMNKLLNK